MHNLLPKEKKRFSYGSSSMEANGLHEKKTGTAGNYRKISQYRA
jgi:hypothetical protein